MKVKLIPQTSYRVETEDGRVVGDFLILEEWHGLMRIHERGNEMTVFGPEYGERIKDELLGYQPQPRLTEVVMASPDLLLFIMQPPVATDELDLKEKAIAVEVPKSTTDSLLSNRV